MNMYVQSEGTFPIFHSFPCCMSGRYLPREPDTADVLLGKEGEKRQVIYTRRPL